MSASRLSQAVAAEIKAEIARHRHTLASVSESAGIPLSTLQRRLSGDGRLSVDEVVAIADVLDVRLGDLVKAGAA